MNYFKRNKHWLWKSLSWKTRSWWWKQFVQSVTQTQQEIIRHIERYYKPSSYFNIMPIYQGKWTDLHINRIKVKCRWNYIRVEIYSARVGLIIGRKGEDLFKLQKYLNRCHRYYSKKKIIVVPIEFNPFQPY